MNVSSRPETWEHSSRIPGLTGIFEAETAVISADCRPISAIYLELLTPKDTPTRGLEAVSRQSFMPFMQQETLSFKQLILARS